LEILEKRYYFEEIVSEEIQDFEKEQKTLIKDEKEKKLNNAFWVGLAFFTILRVVVKFYLVK
jgi:hypothetical protein